MKRTLLSLSTAILIMGSAAACGQQPQKAQSAETEATEQVIAPATEPVTEPTTEEAAASEPAEGVTNETVTGDGAAASASESEKEAPAQSAEQTATVE